VHGDWINTRAGELYTHIHVYISGRSGKDTQGPGGVQKGECAGWPRAYALRACANIGVCHSRVREGYVGEGKEGLADSRDGRWGCR
jgi:hypothetical protein